MNRASNLIPTLVLVVMTGCSLIYTTAPRSDWKPSEPVDCDRSVAAPVADTVVTAAAATFVGILVEILAVDGCRVKGMNFSQEECKNVLPLLGGWCARRRRLWVFQRDGISTHL